jgi:hypothetical protein
MYPEEIDIGCIAIETAGEVTTTGSAGEDTIRGSITTSVTAGSTAATGAIGVGVASFVFFVRFLGALPILVARMVPQASRQHPTKAISSIHCHICSQEPEEPEAFEPKDIAEEPSPTEDPLTLEPPLSEPEDDNADAMLPPPKPDDESHAVQELVVVVVMFVTLLEFCAVTVDSRSNAKPTERTILRLTC